ncbi:unnamed protein product [Adineta ricciae]|uniref:Uncharacterized protein n=1 Tax=Adineta ricciae TaxID=249248 RepID=A0A816B4D3_ADIRI|nr:unnamed protein product [Adineta ricciae]CAF1605400.1 unnamed protein product [Adineta ricciae]
MGTTLSSKKDFNRVLAQQPIASITIPRFDLLQATQSETSIGPIPNPIPELISKPAGQREDEIELSWGVDSFVNTSSLYPDLSYIFLNQIPPKHMDNDPPSDRTTNNNTAIISRSVTDEYDQNTIGNDCTSCAQPKNPIIERNGKQFVARVKQRTERRYVEYLDESTQKKRLFEVIDYVPYRIVEPYKNQSQISLEQESFPTTFQPSRRSNRAATTLPTTADNLSDVSTSDEIEYFSETDSFEFDDQEYETIRPEDINRARNINTIDDAYERNRDIYHEVVGRYELPATIPNPSTMSINPDFQHYRHSSSDISQYISNLPYNQTNLNQNHLYTHINNNVSYI